MGNCLFCKMVSGDIKPDIVYEDNAVLAFRDLNPQAPVHILVIPKKHIATINDISIGDEILIGKLYTVAKKVASQEGISDSGYRAVMNCNDEGGQAVYHIHLHIIGGRSMTWPPG